MNNIQIIQVRSRNLLTQAQIILDSCGPEVTIMASNWEGYGPQETARVITFHRSGRVIKAERFRRRPRRFVAFDNQICGVMVTVFLPEFAPELGGETYVAIETDSRDIYERLFRHLPEGGAYELVAHRTPHERWAELLLTSKNVHHWFLYACSNLLPNEQSAAVYPLSARHLPLVQQFSQEEPDDEDRAVRYLRFQLARFPYQCFGFMNRGELLGFVATGVLSSHHWDVKWIYTRKAVREKGIAHRLATYATNCILRRGKVAVWRTHGRRTAASAAVCTKVGYRLATHEYHFHTLPGGG